MLGDMAHADDAFFASEKDQRKILRKLSARKLAELEADLRRSPPYSKDPPLLQLVLREQRIRQRAPRKRLSLLKVVKAITGRRRR